MKSLLITLLSLLLISGLFLLFNSPKREEIKLPVVGSEKPTVVTGTVVSVNLDQMAFDGPALVIIKNNFGKESTIAIPSMGLLLCPASENITSVSLIKPNDIVSVLGLKNEAGEIVPCANESHYLKVSTLKKDQAIGYQFTYPQGPDGYVLVTEKGESVDSFVSGLSLFNRKEYEAFKANDNVREEPVSIKLMVYRNHEKLSASVWAMRNPTESDVELANSKPVEGIVGGANAQYYTISGLFPTNIYVIANGDYVFVLKGAYQYKSSSIDKDFQALVSSFTFIPTNKLPEDVTAQIDLKKDLIRIVEPKPLEEVSSPLIVTGEARGHWFFEASFPITVTDWDGQIIGEGIATADGNWMTEDFVPFTGEIIFAVPTDTAYKRGTIIFRKDNPSGLPEYDDALELPLRFH